MDFKLKLIAIDSDMMAPCQTLDIRVTRILTSEKMYVIKLYR